MGSLPDILRRAVRGKFQGLGPLASTEPKAAPTAAMYFIDPLQDLIGDGTESEARPIRRLSSTMFESGNAAVIVRYAGARELSRLAARAYRKVYYVIDDDLQALSPSDGLPSYYRRRLMLFRARTLPRILEWVTHIVAPSQHILEGYAGYQGLLLQPAQCHVPGGLGHHLNRTSLELVMAGTRAHLLDLEAIAPAIASFLSEAREARLTTFLGNDAPSSLRNLENVVHLPPLSWLDYRRFVAENRFHLGLAPALDTRLNRGRSVAKLHDHAGFGAAGLYSDQPPFSPLIRDHGAGVLIGGGADEWRIVLRRLADDREKVTRLAGTGQELSRRLGNPREVRSFWEQQLGIL